MIQYCFILWKSYLTSQVYIVTITGAEIGIQLENYILAIEPVCLQYFTCFIL